jgi:hypothetical protein
LFADAHMMQCAAGPLEFAESETEVGQGPNGAKTRVAAKARPSQGRAGRLSRGVGAAAAAAAAVR